MNFTLAMLITFFILVCLWVWAEYRGRFDKMVDKTLEEQAYRELLLKDLNKLREKIEELEKEGKSADSLKRIAKDHLNYLERK